MSFDLDGYVLRPARAATGNASKLNPSTGDVSTYPTGSGPYTYSDFTGYTLRNFTAPQGTFRRVFAGCPDQEQATWLTLEWEADTPVGTSVVGRVKSVFDLEELATAPSYGPFDSTPADLRAVPVPPGKFLEVEMTLSTDTPGVTPVLWSVRATWTCPPVQ